MFKTNFLKKAQEMQEKITNIQKEIENTEIIGESGGGMVKATSNGKGKISKISIDESIINMIKQESEMNKEVLEDLIVAAITSVEEKAENIKKDKMKGFGLPDGMNFPF